MGSKYSFIKLVFIVFLSGFIDNSKATLTPKSKKPKSSEGKLDPKIGPQDYSVFDKNLVSETPTTGEILLNHQAFFKETDEYKFNGFVLGYVTPWNSHGYDIAKIFGNKFTHISPVWLQIKRKSVKKYAISGLHDVDQKWMAHVKNAGRVRSLKIVPRLLFDAWRREDLVKLADHPEEQAALVKVIVDVCKNWKFDGIVLEGWQQLRSQLEEQSSLDLVKILGDGLVSEGLEFILVIPPKRGHLVMFSEKHFDELFEHITAFSLMTYDYAGVEDGPLAPLPWVEECIKIISSDKSKRYKILTGLNFYGNDYTKKSAQAILGRDYIKLLQVFNGKLQYIPEYTENYFEYKDASTRHVVFYPTLHSINQRIKLAEKLGTGLSIWEIGQGLDYFYDLF